MNQITALFGLFACIVFLPACTKDKKPVNPEEVRLLGYEWKQNNGDMTHFTIDYDGSGRISQIVTYKNTELPTTVFTVEYKANETILVTPPPNDPSLTVRDTIRLVRDGGNRLMKRLQYTFIEFSSPHPHQRTYKYDTVDYEYDGAGILKKETRGYKDTTWFNQGVVTSDALRLTGVTSYASAGGNITTKTMSETTSSISYQSGTKYPSSRSSVFTVSFEYKKAYANKTDFSNAAVLKELSLFREWPLDKTYTNLPEKISSTTTEKDQNGTVIRDFSSIQNLLITYNSFGFVSTMADPATPNLKTTFRYNH